MIECFSSLVSWPPKFSCETWRRSYISVSTTLSSPLSLYSLPSHQLYATSKSFDFINKELFCFWSRRHFLSEYKSNINILSGTLLQYFGAANTDSLVSSLNNISIKKMKNLHDLLTSLLQSLTSQICFKSQRSLSVRTKKRWFESCQDDV